MFANNRKYDGLPDLDAAPDIYETPELTDDISSVPTSIAVRSDSRASSYKEQEESNGIDRHRLNPDEARTHFLPARVDARDADFSDRIDGRRKSYRVSRRRRRKESDLDQELGDTSDEDGTASQSLRRRIARLYREAEELKGEVDRRKASGETEGDILDNREADRSPLGQLADALETIDLIRGEELHDAESRLAHRLSAKARPPPTAMSSAASGQSVGNELALSMMNESSDKKHILSKVADFDARLAFLEKMVGLDSIPLPTQDKPSNKAILPTLDSLDRQISILQSTTVSSLDSVTKRVRQLTQDAEKLTEARKAAIAAQDALTSYSEDFPVRDPKAVDTLEDSEQISKINALYGTLPTIESLAPLLPAVLDRLRSLRLIHADAANASENLAKVEQRQIEMAEDIRSWREGLQKVEGAMKDGEARMGSNMKTVEGWVKELEGRMRKLGGG